MAGTIPLSMTQQFDEFGEPLSGGQLFIYQAGTVATPQNPFQDTNLSIALPNPITLDAAGRIPQFFLADGSIKIRLTDVNGVVQLAADNILVIGPSAGGGGGGSVDPTTIMQTGDIKPRYGTGVLTGFVRCNGRSIGALGSPATEFADPTAQALFNYLWNADPTLVVTPSGRGASSAADWANNKAIATPDFRGCAIAGLDDMGNVAANRLTATYFGAVATALGAFGGLESRTLTAAQLPVHQHGVFVKVTDPTHTHTFLGQFGGAGTGTTPLAGVNTSFNTTTNASSTGVTVGVGSVNGVANDNKTDSGSTLGLNGAAHAAIGPRKLVTVYIKL